MKITWKQIRNEVDIEAGPELVWKMLVDVNQYKNWNPFLVQAQGRVSLGSYLELIMSFPDDSSRQKKVLITSLKSCRELSWKGTKGLAFILSGYNRFSLMPLSKHQTRLVQEETFSGLLVPFCSIWLDQDLSVGYKKMLIALKSKVEGQDHSSYPTSSHQGGEKENEAGSI